MPTPSPPSPAPDLRRGSRADIGTGIWLQALSRIAFAALSVLLLVSVLGGPQMMSALGLGFLGRWGAPALWLGFLAGRALRKTSIGRILSEWQPELLLGLALAAGLVLRWPLAGLDLAHYVGPDEGEVVENVLEMMKTGDFHPRHPGYPGLHFYLQMIPATAHYLFAVARGEGRSIPDLPREGFYRVARQTTLLAGCLAALLVYLVGRRPYGRWPAALAGALVGLSPLALRVSRDVSPDLMLMLFAVASLGFSLRALAEPTATRFALAGASVGLAAAIKYTGALLAASYLLAWLLSGKPRRLAPAALAGLGLGFLAFFATSPYTLLDLSTFYRGLAQHSGYYQAGEMNAPAVLTRQIATQGLGLMAAAAALAGALATLTRLERPGLVLLGFPFAYLVLFSFFQKAYQRHAVVILPVFALLAARGASSAVEVLRRPRWLSASLGALVLLSPVVNSVRLGLASRRPTPADRAALWIEENLPAGSLILADQYTPRLDPRRYQVHRLRVEEKVFAGNYEWVLYSGYPPGLPLEGLQVRIRFHPEGSLGSTITLYRVPGREPLMGVTLGREKSRAELGAGEPAYFGQGWGPSEPGAFGTSRLSVGKDSEIFFVLEKALAQDRAAPGAGEKARAARAKAGNASEPESPAVSLVAIFLAGKALPESSPIEVQVNLNGQEVGRFRVAEEEPVENRLVLPARSLRGGLNRILLRYGTTVRLDRRHPEAAIRFYSGSLERRKT